VNPSNANKRVACPGSRALEEKYPILEASPAIKEGIAAHWAAIQVIKGNQDIVGGYAINGESITTEMISGGILYNNCINEIRSKSSLNSDLHLEESLDISNIFPGLQGSPDAWMIQDNHLYIWEYKFGHRFVDVFENWQLLEYAAGIYTKCFFDNITLFVIQPRCFVPEGPVRSWTISKDQLLEYIEILEKAEKLALSPHAPQRPGTQCHQCIGRHACKTLQQMALNTIDLSMDNTPWELSSISVGNELRYLKRASDLLNARITGLTEQAKSFISRGEFVPGFKLESSKGRESWSKSPEEIITLGEFLGIDLAKPREPITPSQAKKIGIDSEILKKYSEHKYGSLKLVESKDAHKIFGNK
jgi:hypothetical protein